MFRFLRRNPALILILLGVGALSFGFLNNVFRIDIPPQDPPPAVAQKYAREVLENKRQTARFYQGGTTAAGLGNRCRFRAKHGAFDDAPSLNIAAVEYHCIEIALRHRTSHRFELTCTLPIEYSIIQVLENQIIHATRTGSRIAVKKHSAAASTHLTKQLLNCQQIRSRGSVLSLDSKLGGVQSDEAIAGVAVGIDLGTTYTAVACVDEYGKPVVLKNSDGQTTMPSAVFFDPPNNYVVGEVAVQSTLTDPDHVVQFVKRFMGVKDHRIHVLGRKLYA